MVDSAPKSKAVAVPPALTSSTANEAAALGGCRVHAKAKEATTPPPQTNSEVVEAASGGCPIHAKAKPQTIGAEQSEGQDLEAPVATPSPAAPAFGPVYACVFIDAVSLGLIIPLLPYYTLEFGATATDVGVVMATFSIAQLFGAMVMGFLSDRVGRRPVLLLSLLGSALSFVFAGLASSLAMLYLSRAAAGLLGGSIPAAQAYIADSVPASVRPKYFARVGICIGCAFTIGPAIGGIASAFMGYSGVFLCAGGVSFVAFLYALRTLKESTRVDIASIPKEEQELQGRVFPVITIGFAMFLVENAWQVMTTVYPLFMRDVFEYGSLAMGLILMFSGVVLILVQGTVHGLIVTGKLGKHGAAALGAVCLAVGLATYPHVTVIPAHYALFAVQVVGYSIEQGALPSTLSRYASAESQGRTLGVGQALKSAGRIAGPLWAGLLYDLQPKVARAFPFAIGAAAAALAAGCLLVTLAWNKRARAERGAAEEDLLAEEIRAAARDAGCPVEDVAAILGQVLGEAREQKCPAVLVASLQHGEDAEAAGAGRRVAATLRLARESGKCPVFQKGYKAGAVKLGDPELKKRAGDGGCTHLSRRMHLTTPGSARQ